MNNGFYACLQAFCLPARFRKKGFQSLLLLSAIMLHAVSFGQALKTIKPTIGAPNFFTKKDQVAWQAVLIQYSKIESGTIAYEALSEAEKKFIDSLEMGYGPLLEPVGCSWYCGGQMYKVVSNSYLKADGPVSYLPENIHDFNLFTAWVPDTTNGVKGKKISFHFKPMSPRVNEIVIYNGYIKNKDLFYANARVKKFRLYVNDQYYATLELADTSAQQSFKIPPLQSKDKHKDLVLTFEIEEIYRGNKYAEVAVSEINFNGLDVH